MRTLNIVIMRIGGVQKNSCNIHRYIQIQSIVAKMPYRSSCIAYVMSIKEMSVEYIAEDGCLLHVELKMPASSGM